MNPIKWLSVCFLTCVLAFSFPLRLCADGTSVKVTVVAASAPDYQITIPATVNTADLNRTSGSSIYSQDLTVTVSDVDFLNGKRICLRLYTEDGRFLLTDEASGATLPYTVYAPGDTEKTTALQNGDVFAAFTEPGSQTGSLCIDRSDIRETGTYTGAILFSITQESIPATD